MDLLKQYMNDEKNRPADHVSMIPSVQLIRNLPTNYHATREFGEDLLKIHGYGATRIQKLFCVRSFALTHGISHAIHLINSHVVSSTDTFPRRLYETQDLYKMPKNIAANLEREVLKWELSKQIPEEDSVVPESETKHILSDTTYEYANIANKFVSRIDDIDIQDKVYSYFRKQVLQMASGCNIFNLINKLKKYDTNEIIEDVLTNDIIPNALHAVHET